MKYSTKNITLLTLLTVAATSASAETEDITLISKSGGLTISGKLLAFDGQAYQVETDLGRITISNSDLTCQGQGCPAAKDRLDAFSLIATDRIPRETLMEFLESYAKEAKKLLVKKGPSRKPRTVELSHPSEGLESIVSFKSDDINLGFSANGSGSPVGYGTVQIISSAPALQNRIDVETLRKIWQGGITNWKQLGGADQAIRLILPIYANDLFESLSRFDADIRTDNVTADVEYFLSSEAIIEAVSQSTDSIGLIYESQASELTVALDMGCNIISIPSDFAIQSMEYPLSYQVTMNSDNGYTPRTAQELQSYTHTTSAQSVFAKVGLLPLVGLHIDSSYLGKRFSDAIMAADTDVGLTALQEFTLFANSATRIAPTLYFAPNGRDLDGRSAKLIQSLTSHLKLPKYENSEILAVGFSDSKGGANANQAVSLGRARTIQSLLATQDVSVDAYGFGEVAPIGCNETDRGRTKNRRVEFWIKN
jgi:phosphate transport system substrate-binding protein